jgi:nucleotide-binding universal stress UspA family protein
MMPPDIQTLLTATDFSAASEPATNYAFRLARALRARLYLLHVIPEEDLRLMTAISQHLQSSITPPTLTDIFYAEADKRLTKLIEEAQATDIVQERFVVTGEPAETIISWAVAKQVQLMLLGTHGRRGIEHFLMGSVAERVLRQAPCAMLVIPAKPE